MTWARPLASYVLRNALLRFVVMFQSYCYFSSSVSFLQIPESFRDLTQAVAPIDDRCYLSSSAVFPSCDKRQREEPLDGNELTRKRPSDATSYWKPERLGTMMHVWNAVRGVIWLGNKQIRRCVLLIAQAIILHRIFLCRIH